MTPTSVAGLLARPLSPWCAIRAPERGRTGAEAALAEANRLAADAAASALAADLHWFDVSALAQTVDGTTAAYSPDGCPRAVGAEAEQLLDAASLVGEPTSRQEHGRSADRARVAAALDAGGRWDVALALPRLPPRSGQIGSALSRCLAAPVTGRLRVTATAAIGDADDSVGDDHDTLALQLLGSRTVTLRQPMVLSPHPGAPDPRTHHLHGTADVEAGSGLFLPRGWEAASGHRDELAVELSYRIRRQSLLDVAEGIVRRAHAHPAVRADVPMDLDAAVRSYDGSVFDREELAASVVQELVAPAQVRSEVARWRASIAPAHGGSLGAILGVLAADDLHDCAGAEIVSDLPGGWWWIDGQPDLGDEAHVAAAGQVLPATDLVVAVAAALGAGSPVALGDLAGLGAPADVLALVQELLRAGLAVAA